MKAEIHNMLIYAMCKSEKESYTIHTNQAVGRGINGVNYNSYTIGETEEEDRCDNKVKCVRTCTLHAEEGFVEVIEKRSKYVYGYGYGRRTHTTTRVHIIPLEVINGITINYKDEEK